MSELDALDDDELLRYLENRVYMDAISSLDSEEYVVESVSASYLSNEYIKELSYNSQSNVFFGYTLSDLNEIFGDTKYVFTLADDGTTTVKEFDTVDDSRFDDIVKNVAIGTGVILVCVTVSVVTAGVGAPAVSVIFAASAKTATTFAVSSAVFGGVASGVARGIETGDFSEAMKASAYGASESFKWGAISGAIAGGATKFVSLKSGTANGLTMNQVAVIQKDSELPMSIIKQMHSMAEYDVYKEAGLKTVLVGNKFALVPDIDWNYLSILPDGTEVTNLQRMLRGLPPRDPATGLPYHVHHVGQQAEGIFAILTRDQHLGNDSILHLIKKGSEVDHGALFTAQKKALYKNLAKLYLDAGV